MPLNHFRFITVILCLPLILNAAELDTIHSSALVIDAHADIEIPRQESRYVGADGKSQVAPEKMRTGGVDAVVMSIAVGPGPRTAEGRQQAQIRANAELNAVVDMIAFSGNKLLMARTATDVRDAHNNQQIAIILGLQNARIFNNQLDEIDRFYELGVRVFALTHMGHNDYADSSRPIFIRELGEHEPLEEHGGLSNLGRSAITRINSLGAIVDISQLSKNAALQAMELSSAPVIASHSNVRGLTDVSRNLSDEELDALALNGGVIHIAPFRGYLYDSNDPDLDSDIRTIRRASGIKEEYLYPFELYWEIDDIQTQQAFLSAVSDRLGQGSIAAMVNHIDYVVQRIGVDHVGIGTDFNHGSGVAGFSDASQAKNVTAELLSRGYSASAIEKIWGGNFLRVMEAAAVSD